ncbi:hypothetical protein ACJJI5_14690 [Microbulbifer sp. EKSA008]
MRVFAEECRVDIARNRELFGLLYSNKGLPNILSDKVCREFYNYVRESDEDLRTLGYVDRKDADKIIAEGRGCFCRHDHFIDDWKQKSLAHQTYKTNVKRAKRHMIDITTLSPSFSIAA